MTRTLIVAALSAAVYIPAADAACVTDFHALNGDAGYRRFRVIDGRRCWYNEGHRDARAQVIRPPKHHPHPRDFHEDAAPDLPQAPEHQDPPPPTQPATKLGVLLLSDAPVDRVDEGFRDLFPVQDHRYVVGAAPFTAPAEPAPVEEWHPYRLMLIACGLSAILAWFFARWMLPDVAS